MNSWKGGEGDEVVMLGYGVLIAGLLLALALSYTIDK